MNHNIMFAVHNNTHRHKQYILLRSKTDILLTIIIQISIFYKIL